MSADDACHAEIALLQRHAQELGEQFDSVQIFVTRHEPAIHDGTINLNLGVGNYYARFGQIVKWLIRQDEQVRSDEREQQS